VNSWKLKRSKLLDPYRHEEHHSTLLLKPDRRCKKRWVITWSMKFEGGSVGPAM